MNGAVNVVVREATIRPKPKILTNNICSKSKNLKIDERNFNHILMKSEHFYSQNEMCYKLMCKNIF